MKSLSSENDIKSGAYIRSTRLFFEPSKLFEAQLTEIFDRLWPTLTALKMLRWEVRGYAEEIDVKSNEQLTRRFVDPCDKTLRPNLYRTCILDSWDCLESALATDLLINLFARYEGWCANILVCLGKSGQNALTREKWLQSEVKFPNLLSELCVGTDPALSKSFYDVYRLNNSRFHNNHLSNYFKVYHFFKECRNCIIHSGGKINDRIIGAESHIQGFITTDLDIAEIPSYSIGEIGDDLILQLRGVVGFSQILLNIVSTIDIEFIKAATAKDYFTRQVKKYANIHKPNFVKDRKIISMSNAAHFRKLTNYANLRSILQREGIIL